jgi:hypothetical protein
MSLQFLNKEKNKKKDLKKEKRENEVEKPEFIGQQQLAFVSHNESGSFYNQISQIRIL